MNEVLIETSERNTGHSTNSDAFNAALATGAASIIVATTEPVDEPTETTTAEPAAYTLWDALTQTGENTQFDLTLFAPSDAELAAFDPAALPALAADPASAESLVTITPCHNDCSLPT